MSAPKFIIRYQDRFPVRLVKNVSGSVFELVEEARATDFANEGDAYQAARNHGIRLGNITVAPKQNQKKGSK